METDPHGGVVLALRTTFNPILVSSVSKCEILFCDISVNSCKISLYVCYRPCLSNVEQSFSFIIALIQHGGVSYELCVVGDLDMPGINWTVENSSCSVQRTYFQMLLMNLNFIRRYVNRHEEQIFQISLYVVILIQYEISNEIKQFSESDSSCITFSSKIRQSQDHIRIQFITTNVLTVN